MKRAVAQDGDRPVGLIQNSGACRGPYASIISGYRVTADYITRHQVFAAVDEIERLQGFYALLLKPPELNLAFVADDVQGRGVDRLLIEPMITQAGAADLTEVRVVSHPSAKFYRRLGTVRARTVVPSPPKVKWERPELQITTI